MYMNSIEIQEGIEIKKQEDHMSIETAKDTLARFCLERDVEDMNRKEVSEKFLEKVPVERRDAIEEAYSNSSEAYLNLMENNIDDLVVKDCDLNEGSYYYGNAVYMQKKFDDDEYADVFRHEVAHYIDEQQGWYSENIEFINAVYDDTMLMNFKDSSTKEYRNEMMSELFNSDVCYNRHISDILSAVSRNDKEVVLKYAFEGVPYYRHKNEYFDSGHNRENEIYADFMACIGENNQETIGFLQKYFPNTYNETMKCMEEVHG